MGDRLAHRWSVGHNYLSGITLGRWLRLLSDNRFDVDLVYGHRVAFVTLLAAMNSAWALLEDLRFARAIERTPIEQPPLFVLGHWRSGTTHLHNLLALDTATFAFASTYEVVSPSTFLTTQALNTRLFGWMVPRTRPMDNMELSFDAPQEDELALAILSLRSMYFTITFPRRDAHYERFLTFREAPLEDVERWRAALVWFVRKLTLRHRRPILLKSPCHTARIRLLLETFPGARFVHIHRDPYVVFQSSRHYFDTAAWYTYLQRPDRSKLDQEILDRYAELYEAFFAERALIPAGRFHEIAFDELERDPVRALRSTYEALSLPGFQAFEPRLAEHVRSLAGYRKNQHRELDPATRARVAAAWAQSFDEWGYAR